MTEINSSKSTRKFEFVEKCTSCSYTLTEFIQECKSEDFIKTFLKAHEVVPQVRECPVGHVIHLDKKGKAFRCQRRDEATGIRCSWYRSRYHNTFLHRTKIKLDVLLILAAHWLFTAPPRHHRLALEGKMTGRTLVELERRFRVLIVRWRAKSKSSEQIGGEGKIVEIDEAKFGSRKFNMGRRVKGQWVFGGRERGDRTKMFVVPVVDTTRETLYPIIFEKIHPKSTIMSDCNNVYYTLKNYFHRHYEVNHKRHFVTPKSMKYFGEKRKHLWIHTNTVERMWRALRLVVPKYGRRTMKHFIGYLAEFEFYRKYKPKERIHAFFLEMSKWIVPRRKQISKKERARRKALAAEINEGGQINIIDDDNRGALRVAEEGEDSVEENEDYGFDLDDVLIKPNPKYKRRSTRVKRGSHIVYVKNNGSSRGLASSDSSETERKNIESEERRRSLRKRGKDVNLKESAIQDSDTENNDTNLPEDGIRGDDKEIHYEGGNYEYNTSNENENKNNAPENFDVKSHEKDSLSNNDDSDTMDSDKYENTSKNSTGNSDNDFSEDSADYVVSGNSNELALGIASGTDSDGSDDTDVEDVKKRTKYYSVGSKSGCVYFGRYASDEDSDSDAVSEKDDKRDKSYTPGKSIV